MGLTDVKLGVHFGDLEFTAWGCLILSEAKTLFFREGPFKRHHLFSAETAKFALSVTSKFQPSIAKTNHSPNNFPAPLALKNRVNSEGRVSKRHRESLICGFRKPRIMVEAFPP